MTMKTPEELADEYNKQLEQVPIMYYLPTEPCRKAFLAGYQAAKEHAHAALEEAEAKIQELEDQVADGSKVMPDTCEHILDMEKMVDVNGWISVKDRLPEPRNGSGINVLVLISGDGWHDHDVAYFGPTTWRDKYGDFVEGVTHWMPLPKLPEEEG